MLIYRLQLWRALLKENLDLLDVLSMFLSQADTRLCFVCGIKRCRKYLNKYIIFLPVSDTIFEGGGGEISFL